MHEDCDGKTATPSVLDTQHCDRYGDVDGDGGGDRCDHWRLSGKPPTFLTVNYFILGLMQMDVNGYLGMVRHIFALAEVIIAHCERCMGCHRCADKRMG